MPESEPKLYELGLECGDTVSSKVVPRIGAYRFCIHCDGMKRVIGILEPRAHEVDDRSAPATAETVVRDAAYGYAFAYGHVSYTLEAIRSMCDSILRQASSEHEEWLRSQIGHVRQVADEAIRYAEASLGRDSSADSAHQVDA